MKFQLKALAAAVILVAALPAQAAYNTGTTGNGSLLLTVLDRTNGVSALFDLGKSYSEFNVTGSDFTNSGITTITSPLTWNLATDANYKGAWDALFANGASLGNLRYGIMATDSVGGTNAGDQGYISSWLSGTANFANASLITAGGNFDTYATNNTLATLFNSHGLYDNGGDVAKTTNTGLATAFYNAAGRGGSSSGPVVMAAIGTSMGVIQSVVSSWDGSNSFSNQTIFGNDATFNLTSEGALSYSVTYVAPVPEADTWAMMMLGLGFMGFVARRKQA
jgi:hypothetical protein